MPDIGPQRPISGIGNTEHRRLIPYTGADQLGSRIALTSTRGWGYPLSPPSGSFPAHHPYRFQLND